MARFKEYFNTEVTLTVTRNGKLVGKCTIAGMDKTLAISHATQKYLCQNLSELEPGTIVESPKLDVCKVILCRAKGKNYWMISNQDHKRDKVLSIQNVKIDPDKLLDIWEKEGIAAAAKELALLVESSNNDDLLPNMDLPTDINNEIIDAIQEEASQPQEEHDSFPIGFVPNDNDEISDLDVENFDSMKDFEEFTEDVNPKEDTMNELTEIPEDFNPKKDETDEIGSIPDDFDPKDDEGITLKKGSIE